jgi:hypothetical protein
MRSSFAIFAAAILAGTSGCETSRSGSRPDSTNYFSLKEALPLAKSRVEELRYVGGFGGLTVNPSPFLMLSVVFIESRDQELIKSFIESNKPNVQAMGLACLAQTDTNAFEIAWNRLKDDKREIYVFTGGCIPLAMTLGALASELRTNRNFLGYFDDYWDFQKYRKKVKRGMVPQALVRYSVP